MKKSLILLTSMFLLNCAPLLVNGENSKTLTSEKNELTTPTTTNTEVSTKQSSSVPNQSSEQNNSTDLKEQTTTKNEKDTETTASTEASDQKEKSSPAEKTPPLPGYLQGDWIVRGDDSFKLTLTDNKYITNGTEYNITKYVTEGNHYTLNWDEEAYIQKYGKQDFWNPQPLMFEYDVNRDLIYIGSLTYTRKPMTDIDPNKFEKYVENEDIPGFLQDKWVGSYENEKVTFTIGARTISSNDVQNYTIIAYGIIGNQYTFIWDINDYINQYGKPGIFNPQPFIFTYNQNQDTLTTSGGVVLKRESKKIIPEEKIDNNNKSTNNNNKVTSILPKTGEKNPYFLVIVGSMLSVLGGTYLVIKFKR